MARERLIFSPCIRKTLHVSTFSRIKHRKILSPIHLLQTLSDIGDQSELIPHNSPLHQTTYCKFLANKAQSHSQFLINHLQLRTTSSTSTQAITLSAFTCEKVSGVLVLSMSGEILFVSSVSYRAAKCSLFMNHTCFSTARSLSLCLSVSYELLQPMAFIKCYFLLCWELKETIMMLCFLMAAPWKDQKNVEVACLLFLNWYLCSSDFLKSLSPECWNYDLLLFIMIYYIASVWTPSIC